MDCLAIGEKINIFRTDGRIQSAVVNTKKYFKRTVSVIWPEGSQVLVKEIPWCLVLQLNPHLRSRIELSPHQSQMEKLYDTE